MSDRIPRRRVAWWQFLRSFCELGMGLAHGYRGWGQARVPRRGPVLLVSNHQSFYDPVLVGMAVGRPFYAMARRSLFDFPGVGWLIRSLNALPVERGSADRRSLRRAAEVLAAGAPLLVFPEGTRSRDGRVQPFARGTLLLIKQTRPAVVPVGIAGAERAWPRDAPAPRPGARIGATCGEPIASETLLAMEEDAALELLRARVAELRDETARRLGIPATPPRHCKNPILSDSPAFLGRNPG